MTPHERILATIQIIFHGGYIPSSCHNIQAGTPPENVVAMIETVQQWSI